MSERGFVSVDRGVFDHPMFAPEPFTEREAWLWMIAEAAWKPMTVRAGRAVLQIDRGQIACSLRFLATRWKWPETSVRRFLSRLAAGGDDALVLIDAAQSVTRITICNYDKYQAREDEGETDSGTPAGTDVGQMWDTKEEGEEGKKEKKDNYRFSGRVIKLTEAHFGQWQSSYPALDLSALLQSRDDWLAEEAPPEQRKKWFTSTSNWLASKQQLIAASAKEGAGAKPDVFWG